ncbi:MAG: hypothetical protein J2P25_20275 [Nocardiopsaceae bacterium]|nr:hypothetical protein [Nocardiopsaceae bacterium]
MQLPELWENLPEPFRTERVLGEPREAGDGTTIIPAITVRGRVGSGGGDGQDAGHGRGPRFTAAPAGIYVIREGKAQWVPATRSTLLGVLGISCGLAASVLFGIAAIRRAPWPDVRIRVTRTQRGH